MGIAVWTATTDGDNCPLHTTVHWTQAEAEARVRNDLSEDCPPLQLASLAALAGDELMFAWNNRHGGACIIEAHKIADSAADRVESETLKNTALALERRSNFQISEALAHYGKTADVCKGWLALKKKAREAIKELRDL